LVVATGACGAAAAGVDAVLVAALFCSAELGSDEPIGIARSARDVALGVIGATTGGERTTAEGGKVSPRIGSKSTAATIVPMGALVFVVANGNKASGTRA
jgi:hypothetical protein